MQHHEGNERCESLMACNTSRNAMTLLDFCLYNLQQFRGFDTSRTACVPLLLARARRQDLTVVLRGIFVVSHQCPSHVSHLSLSLPLLLRTGVSLIWPYMSLLQLSSYGQVLLLHSIIL